ncbi:hypothetical protein KKJ25_00605 [Xenorhabdus bovienii]|uniref:Uncharacterized protein n=1 Tax=Xenorhabdus bovienii TaxID=40576 RepID=A0AAJ1JAN6_XENBV|nr:hypothetical protein [Xenorhabdus bovienii]MDE1479257.1 hypothetical protein [Xenorhabdus bovienii]MDE1492654.1 hypothetical protein [Xenorhabdus bovienii]MDE1493516.1 hypothetical protein [Xenorhabdus bovienii]MDE9471612.1 hypothetical protein [Xenorhabdus bovienii]MDE9510936.1 hypothetical protein [Xenorhabdus bovienii]
MSDELFILDNVNAALNHYSMGNGIENGLYPHSPAYWCSEQVAKLTDAEREAALFRLSVWDVIYCPVRAIDELRKPGSDVWNYSIAEMLTDSSKNDLLVSACAIWGWGLTEESDNTSCHLAASNLVFAVLAQEQYDSDIMNEFENLEIKEVRSKAAKAKHEAYYAPLKAQFLKWAQEIIDTTSGAMTKKSLATAVDTRYLGWIKENPRGTSEYRKLHPLNDNGELLKEPVYRTIYGWVEKLLPTNRRPSKKK